MNRFTRWLTEQRIKTLNEKYTQLMLKGYVAEACVVRDEVVGWEYWLDARTRPTDEARADAMRKHPSYGFEAVTLDIGASEDAQGDPVEIYAVETSALCDTPEVHRFAVPSQPISVFDETYFANERKYADIQDELVDIEVRVG